MKRIFALMFVALALIAGCHAQQLPPTAVTTAPPVTSTAFTQLNVATPTATLAYVDQPAAGAFCYFVQMLDAGGTSAASNVVCTTTTSAQKHVNLAWNAPAGYTCITACTFVVSRAAAVLTPVGTPTMQPGTTAAQVKPALPASGDPELARLELRLRLR
jgi:hypothetical protein